MKSKEKNIGIIIDVLAVLLFVIILAGNTPDKANIQTNKYVWLIVSSFSTYCFFRLIMILIKTKMSVIWIWLTAFFYGFEIVYGILQLTGLLDSGSHIFAITGSFANPGPFGGLLTLCICSFLPLLRTDRVKGVLRIIVYIEVILSFSLILPANSRAAILALIVSLLLMAYASDSVRQKMRDNKKLVIAIFVALVALGVFGYYVKKPSADGRLFAARRSVAIMVSNRGKGVGLANYSKSYAKEKVRYFSRIMEDDAEGLKWQNISESERMNCGNSLNVYNDYLQIGVECGFIPMLLFCIICCIAAYFSYKARNTWSYPFIALCVFANFSYPMMTSELRTLFIVLLCLCINTSDKEKNLYHKISLSVALAGTILFIWNKRVDFFHYSQSNKMYLDMFYRTKDDANEFYNAAESMYYDLDDNFNFLLEYGKCLYHNKEYDKSISELKRCADVYADPNIVGLIGDNYCKKGEYDKAEEYYRQSFMMEPNLIRPLYNLARLYLKEGDTARFYTIYDVSRGFVPKKESDRTGGIRIALDNLYQEISNNNK